MKSRRLLLFAGALLIALLTNLMPAIGRDAPITTIGSANPCPGTAITLPVTVTNFTQITAVSLRIDYNPNLVTFVSATNLNATLNGLIVNDNVVSPTLHKIIFVWSDINPKDLTNGAKLADLNFTFVTGSGSVAFNNTSSGGSDCEYGDETGNPMNDVPTANFYFNGTITNAGPNAAGAITGTSPVCQSTNGVAYSVGAITNATGYTWTFPTGATIASGSGTNSITLNYSASAASGNVTVAGTNACPNPGTSSAFPVVVNTRPVPNVFGITGACVGTTGVIYSTELGMTGYTWAISSGGTITAGQGTNSVTVTWSTAGVQTISVTYNGTTGCAALTPTIKSVSVNPLPVPTITGPASICIGTATNVYTTEASMTGYTWTVSAGGTITAGAGTNSITVTWNTAGAQTVGVNYTNVNGCTATSPTSYSVTVNALPVPTITGPATACVNVTGNVYTTQAGMSSYVWSVSSGGTITSGGTSASNTVTVTWTTAGAKTVTVNYNNSNGCTAATPTTYNVTVNALPVPTITGTSAFCGTSTGDVYSTEAGMTGYTWTISAGGTITAGIGTNTVTVSWNSTGAQTLNVNYLNANGCTAASATVKNVAVNPLPLPTISGPAICGTGIAGNVYTTEAGMSSYVWTVSAGGTITAGGGATNNTVTITWTTAGAKTVTVSYTNANGCVPLTPTSYPVNVIDAPGPAGPISGPASVCQNASNVAYLVAPILNATGYVWTLPTGATIATGLNTNSITVIYSLTAVSGSMTVYGTNSFGNGTVSPAYAITVNPIPSPSITGTATVCAGTAGVVYTTQPGMTNYLWTVSSGGSITAGGTTSSNTVTVTWNTPGAQTVGVNYAGTGGCTAAAPVSYPVTVNPTPVPTITGPSTVCAGSTGNVYTTQAGMTSYVWNVSAGGTITAGGTSTSNTVTVTWATSGAKTVSVNYTNGSGCSAATPTTYNVTVNVLPTPTITGTATLCAGTTGNVYTTQAGMSAYVWTVSAGGTITAGGTSTSNTATVTWNTAGAQSVSVNYANANGCSAASATSYPVTVNPLPVVVISGPASACAGLTGNTYTTALSMTNYIWTVSAGGTITAGGTSTSNFVTVTWNTTGAQTVSVNYTNSTGCTAAVPTVYNVTVTPIPAPTITGPNTICASSGSYYNTEPGMLNYSWTVSSGGSITSGQGTNSVFINWNGSGAQTLSVIYSNPSGCSPANPTVLNVTVNALPSAAGSITGTSTVCAGTTGVNYSVGPITNALSYAWSLPAGATIVSGNYTNSITVDFSANATSGPITVSGNNLCGDGPASPPFQVMVNGIPAAAGTITGTVNVCQGTNGVAYNVAAIANATGYTWTLPSGATIASGSNTNSITVNFSSSAASGNITVLGTNSCGSGTVSPAYAVTVNPVPSKPLVNASGNTLSSSAASGNQWYWNGTAVSGATSQVYQVPVGNPGNYWTIVTLNGCSSDSSNHVYVAGVGVQDNEELTFVVYPVPNDGRFTITMSALAGGKIDIQVINDLGVTIFSEKDIPARSNFTKSLDLRPLPAGVYTVLVSNNAGKASRRIIVK